eukprot:scaffold3767_cov114-Isochrysis_galbana.AAC.15
MEQTQRRMRCAGRTRSAGRTRKGVLWRLAVVRGAAGASVEQRDVMCDVCCVESYKIFMSVDTLQLAARGLCSWAAPLCDCANMATERTPTRHTSHPHALLERPHRPPRTAALSHQN